MVALLLLPSML